MRVVLGLLAFCCVHALAAQNHTYPDSALVYDYRPDWRVYRGDAYQPLVEDARAIYFQITRSNEAGAQVCISQPTRFSLLVNGRLWRADLKGSHCLRVDSLAANPGLPLTLGVYSEAGVSRLVTHRVAASGAREELRVPRPSDDFYQFSILAALLLFTFFAVLLRASPKLMQDYVDVSRVFAIRERDENLQATRITSSINILFLFFCCLLCAYVFLISFNYKQTQADTLGGFFWLWLIFSLLLSGSFAIKFFLTRMWAAVFLMDEFSSLQFFNFVRMLIQTCAAMALIGLVFYGFGLSRQALFQALQPIINIALTVATVFLFLKLMGRTRQSLFHLFFYLCVSEIIPLVVLIKVFLY
ncbi:MAG TPA: hypothetical protein DCE81_03410 [Cytophagales bacterium]|nr:hypothetical protein [Cytophagales bacterium]